MDVITTHVNADFDCLGSMIAARKLYPDAKMVFAGGTDRTLRNFLLESAVYAYDFTKIKDIDLGQVTRLILVDVCHAERIGPFAELLGNPDVELHIYDHHPRSEESLTGTVEHIRNVGATVTVITPLLMERGVVPEPDEATMMLLGLYEDTGSLLFSSTTSTDFAAAQYLFECGGSLNTVADFLTREMSFEQVQLLNDLLESRRIITMHGIEIGLAHASTDHFIGDLAVLANKIKDMDNLDALFVAARMGDRIFLVGRSRVPEVHAGEVLSEFGGGGHSYAASGTVRELTLVQILDQFPEALQRHVHRPPIAQEIMSSPARSVDISTTIAEVRQALTRYNHNSLPVLSSGKPVGLITRQVAERASHHGLDDVLVEEYMREDFATISQDADLETLHDLIVEKGLRLLPVIEKGEMVGVITRTDLLQYLLQDIRDRRGKTQKDLSERSSSMNLQKRAVGPLMSDRLPKRIHKLLKHAGKVADRLGLDIYVVGGFVRDMLVARRNLDVDLVVEGDGIAFANEFAKEFSGDEGCRVRSHKKFGTAVLVFPDEFKIDIASTRMEYYQEPGALPTVEYASIKLDLYRRDFTINTLAIRLNGDYFGELIDYFGAQRDLKERVVRVLHNLSFVEDPTRVFRAIRFEQRLSFEMGKQTEQLVRSAVKMGFLNKVAGPRLLTELSLILREDDPLPALRRMGKLGLFRYVDQEINFSDKQEKLFSAITKGINWYELSFTGGRYRRWLVYLMALTDTVSRSGMTLLADRLNLAEGLRQELCERRQEGLELINNLYHNLREFDNFRLEYHLRLERLSVEMLIYLLSKNDHQEIRTIIVRHLTEERGLKPMINGETLTEMGLPPGPVYRQVFDRLLAARLSGQVLTLEDEKALVERDYFS